MLKARTAPRVITLPGISYALRYQLVASIVLGVLLPASPFFFPHLGEFRYHLTGANTVVAAMFATISAMLLLRRISDFPGTVTFHYTLPVYSGTYGAVVAVILGLRINYSSSIIVSAFVFSLGVQYLLNLLGDRFGGAVYYAVPGGRIGEIRLPSELDMVHLTMPQVPNGRAAVMVADLHHEHSPEWERAIAQTALDGIPVYHYKQVWEAATGRVQIEHLSENSFGSLLPSLPYRKAKRLLDLALCLMITPVIVLPLLIIALIIRMESPGAALFRQERMGYRGRTFRVVKFRTMRVPTAEEACTRTSAITQHNDERITKTGRFLRRTRIDELPQIFNIVRGEMSWIGPRPEAVALSAWYEAEIPFYSYRHIVRPGISGWAQVNQGHVTDVTDVHAKLQYDFFYIKNFSHWMDILILLRTARVVVTGFGAK